MTAPVAALVDLLVEVLKAAPAVKVVPEVVERLDGLLAVPVRAEHRHGLHSAEARLALEHGPELLEEVRVRVARRLHLFLGRHVRLEVLVVRVDGIELTALLGVREDLHRLLDALEEGVVV